MKMTNSYMLEAKEDIIKFKNWLNNEDIFNLYYKLKSRLKSPYNDIYYVMKNMTQKEFSQYLNDLAQTKTSSQKRNEILDGAELVSENSEFKCYHITTHEASVLLGRNAQWCISMKDNARYWKSYTSKGIKFYFFIGKNDEKYALALYPRILKYEGLNANFELFNQQDKEISVYFKNYNFPKIPNVDLVFESKYNKDGLYIEENVLIKALPTVTYAVVPEGVTEISRIAFKFCEKLKSVKLPNSLNIIGWQAFYSCKSLTSIEIPDSVTEIGSSAFVCCRSLKTVRLPKNLKEIEANTFENCKSLTILEFPNSVTTIGDYAFYGCSSLTSVVIPNSVTTIGDYAFYGCSSLTSIEIPNSVTTIGDRAFYDCSNLTNIEIPNSVTTIGGSAFSGCSSLTSVVIPSSVTTIGYSAFSDCNNLTSVVIPNSVTTIGYSAFSGCSSLTSVVIPSSVTTIGYYAFYGCSNLTIYCEASEQPKGWNSKWNSSNCPVVWNYKNKDKEIKESQIINLSNREEVKNINTSLFTTSITNSEINPSEKEKLCVIDKEAFSSEELLPSYEGRLVLKCPICSSLYYYSPNELDDLVKNDDGTYNIESGCNVCRNTDSFEIDGSVENNQLVHTEHPEELLISIEKGNSEFSGDSNIPKDKNIPASYKIDNISMEGLINKYLNSVYTNVKSFKISSATALEGNKKLVIEGDLTYTSDTTKPTTFIFEKIYEAKGNKGKVRYNGLNGDISKNKTTYSLMTITNNNSILGESLTYHYKQKGTGVFINGNVKSYIRNETFNSREILETLENFPKIKQICSNYIFRNFLFSRKNKYFPNLSLNEYCSRLTEASDKLNEAYPNVVDIYKTMINDIKGMKKDDR